MFYIRGDSVTYGSQDWQRHLVECMSYTYRAITLRPCPQTTEQRTQIRLNVMSRDKSGVLGSLQAAAVWALHW